MNNIDKATVAKIVALVVEQIQSTPANREEIRKVALSSGLYEDKGSPQAWSIDAQGW